MKTKLLERTHIESGPIECVELICFQRPSQQDPKKRGADCLEYAYLFTLGAYSYSAVVVSRKAEMHLEFRIPCTGCRTPEECAAFIGDYMDKEDADYQELCKK